jgi:hypothetical protein
MKTAERRRSFPRASHQSQGSYHCGSGVDRSRDGEGIRPSSPNGTVIGAYSSTPTEYRLDKRFVPKACRIVNLSYTELAQGVCSTSRVRCQHVFGPFAAIRLPDLGCRQGSVNLQDDGDQSGQKSVDTLRGYVRDAMASQPRTSEAPRAVRLAS